jgi:hypothetical protein
MNIKWLARISYLDSNILQVEWLGAEDMKQEVRGSSVDGYEAAVTSMTPITAGMPLSVQNPVVKGVLNRQ